MRLPLLAAAASVFSRSAVAHYMFSHLLVNNTETAEWRYIRDVAGDPQYANVAKVLPQVDKTSPQYHPAILTPETRCGRSGWQPSPNTETADVVAGSEVGFRLSLAWPGSRNNNPPSYIFHPGPGQVYLARLPSAVKDLSSWDGDGDWFKIAYAGPTSDTAWYLLNKREMNFTIPSATPPGKYLMRMEHFMHGPGNDSQWYVNCAQINVLGNGGGVPSGFARFPGTYQLNDTSIRVVEAGTTTGLTKGLNSYIPPGPPVWKG